MEIIFYDSTHYLKPLLYENESLAGSLKILDQKMIVRNIHNLLKKFDFDIIKIPIQLIDALNLVKEHFPLLNVVEYDNESIIGSDGVSNINGKNDNEVNDTNNGYKVNWMMGDVDNYNYLNGVEGRMEGSKSIKIPINSIVNYSVYDNGLDIKTIVYPWDLLISMKEILKEITETKISPSASIASSSIIQGPCIIGDNVIIDDFCKIKGPVYIGNNSIIGTGSLVRNCMIGENTKIGFSCEISNSYLRGNDVMAHLNIVAESVIGENVWFAGNTATANVLLTKQNIKYDLGKGKSVDTGTFRFGAFIGNNCKIGASVIILPGRQIPSGISVNQNSIFAKHIDKKS